MRLAMEVQPSYWVSVWLQHLVPESAPVRASSALLALMQALENLWGQALGQLWEQALPLARVPELHSVQGLLLARPLLAAKHKPRRHHETGRPAARSIAPQC